MDIKLFHLFLLLLSRLNLTQANMWPFCNNHKVHTRTFFCFPLGTKRVFQRLHARLSEEIGKIDKGRRENYRSRTELKIKISFCGIDGNRLFPCHSSLTIALLKRKKCDGSVIVSDKLQLFLFMLTWRTCAFKNWYLEGRSFSLVAYSAANKFSFLIRRKKVKRFQSTLFSSCARTSRASLKWQNSFSSFPTKRDNWRVPCGSREPLATFNKLLSLLLLS